MADVKALLILSQQIKSFKEVQNPPRNLDDVESYTKNVKKVSNGAQAAVLEVKSYIEEVEKKVEELKNAQQILIKKYQDVIQEIFESLKSQAQPELISAVEGTGTKYGKGIDRANGDRYVSATAVVSDKTYGSSHADNPALEKLQLAHKLQESANEIFNDRLGELIMETETVCAKLKDGMDICDNDIDELNGCLQNWRSAKKKSFEEERRAMKMRKEKEENAKKERESQKRMEEARNQRKKEDAERKAEEERKQREEAEIIRMEEELLQRQEEEEQIKREEEEKMNRLEEDRKRREEEAARKREEAARKQEEERQRLEAKEREKERVQKEAEERAWRQNPNNWNNVTYSRDCDEVDGKRAYHGGITCVMASPPGSIEKDDVECSASDEVDSVIETLEIDEKPVSSILDIHSRKGNLHSEVASRIYIPHYSAFSSNDETVVKISLNHRSWVTVSPVPSTPNMEEHEKVVQGMACFEVNDFSSLRAIVVTRPRCQTIIVDVPGISIRSTMDKKVNLFVPRNAFGSRTELKLMVQSVSEQALASFVNDNNDLNNILAVSSIVTLICGKEPAKAIQVDLTSSQRQNSGKIQRGKTYQLYTSKDKVWKFADVECKGHQDDITVVLPAGREKYTIMELDMPSSFPRESVPSVAEALQTCINRTVVVMIVKQHADDYNSCVVRVVRREICLDTLNFLAENGYSEGPDASPQFSLHEGQQLEFYCTGNIENRAEKDLNKYTYLSYMGGVETDMTLHVKDSWKQKDLPAYVGTIRCRILNRSVHSETLCMHAAELKISLPKQMRQRGTINVARVRVPFYLITLASYLSHTLCKDDKSIWETVLKSLLGSSEFSSACRNAKRKTAESDEESVCRTVLLDWMKAQAMHVDKLGPITVALKYNGYEGIAQACIDFVRFQKENLSDAVLIELAQGITKDVHTLGKDLGLDKKEIEKCIKQHPNNIKSQYIAEMMEWRESDRAIEQHDNALEYLRNMCV